MAIVLKLEEELEPKPENGKERQDSTAEGPRNFNVTAVGTTLESALQVTQPDTAPDALNERIQVIDFGADAPQQMVESPGEISKQPSPRTSPFSRPRSWLRQSPSNNSRPRSYFHSSERKAFSQSPVSEKNDIQDGNSNRLSYPSSPYKVVIRDRSSSAPWPLHTGAHALSPFSSAWPGPGATIPTAQPAVPSWRRVPELESLPEPHPTNVFRTNLQGRTSPLQRKSKVQQRPWSRVSIETAKERTLSRHNPLQEGEFPGAEAPEQQQSPRNDILGIVGEESPYTRDIVDWAETSQLRLTPSPGAGGNWL